jgi:hypothetical protein
MERLWLGERGGGEGPGGPGGVFLEKVQREREKRGCCKVFLNYCPRFAWIPSSFFQTLQDKRERYCYSVISTKVCQSAGEVNNGGLVKFQLILNL